jgi:hypothetical protein
LQQGDASSPLVFTITLEYDIQSIQANQEGLKLNGTDQLLVYDDDVNILIDSIHTIEKNTEALVVSVKEFGLMLTEISTWFCVLRSECRTKSRYKD